MGSSRTGLVRPASVTRILTLALVSCLALPGLTAQGLDFGQRPPGGVHPASINIANVCKKAQTFIVQVVGAPWLSPQTTTVKKVKKGKPRTVALQANLQNLSPGIYQGKIEVSCSTCSAKCPVTASQIDVKVEVTSASTPSAPATAAAAGGLTAAEAAGALTLGITIAREAKALDRAELGDKAHAGRAGLLVAEGDSWFDYPGADVLKMLERKFDYRVERVSHKGDTLEDMSYNPRQLAGLAGRLKVIRDRGEVPKAVLVSGGGNDIAGPELAMLLNHRRSGLSGVDPVISSELIGRRLQAAMISLLASITELCRDSFGKPLPILVHGYDYLVPDGRGFLGGYRLLPGPWLQPTFRRKGFDAGAGELEEEKRLMRQLIDLYNEMLQGIPRIPGLEHVSYVRVAGTLSSGDDYLKDWSNEIHPTPDGFHRVAARFDAKLRELP